jgi:hypothetical protein
MVQAIEVLFEKARGFSQQGNHANEEAVYNEIVQAFGDADDLERKRQVSRALINRGVVLGQMERLDDAKSVFETIDNRYGNAEDLELKARVAMALVNKGVVLG